VIKVNFKKIAKAYADGICKTLGVVIPDDEPTETVDNGILYRVQVGAFSVKENAEKYLEGLKKAGYTDAYITTDSKK